MTVRKISEIGSNVIRSKARNVSNINTSRLRKLLKDMTDTMRKGNLIGIAAPQINEGLRIFVTEIRKTKLRKKIKEKDGLRVFINPRVLSHSKKLVTGHEGCGSVAFGGIFGPVNRYDSILVQAEDIERNKFKLKARGLLARVIQHEIDHLNGIVFIDRVANTRHLLGEKEYLKRKK